jgi:hypothetical protein
MDPVDIEEQELSIRSKQGTKLHLKLKPSVQDFFLQQFG